MEDMRSHLSYTKLTPLLRCLPPLMNLGIGVEQILEPLQSSVLFLKFIVIQSVSSHTLDSF